MEIRTDVYYLQNKGQFLSKMDEIAVLHPETVAQYNSLGGLRTDRAQKLFVYHISGATVFVTPDEKPKNLTRVNITAPVADMVETISALEKITGVKLVPR